MELRIVHTTGFEYAGFAGASYNEVRMEPQTDSEQIVVHSRLDITPAPWIYHYRDYFGAQVTAFEVLDEHSALTITATSTVHTHRGELAEPELDWETLRSEEVADRHTEYLMLPDHIAPPPDLAALVEQIAAESATPGEAARKVCELVYAEVKYVSGSTAVTSRAADSWEQRSGVCQDMAHITIGALRHLGIPTRYVSGYLHPRRDPEVGETVTGESHAWVEWWDDGWCGFDPTNDVVPGDRHVVVAVGRDYTDVKPLSGLYSGAATESMAVSVQITRLA